MILKATKAKSYSVFLPSLAYQEARGYSKKCWNAKEALLTNLYISQLLLFCITKTQSWLRLVDPVNTVFKAFQAWQISISQQLCFIGTFFSSNCQGCFWIVSQRALKIRIIYMSHMCSPPPTSMGKWYRFSNKQGFWCYRYYICTTIHVLHYSYISIPDYLGTKKDPERSVLNSITFRKNSGDTDNMGCSFRCCSEKRNSTGESTQSLEMITCIFSNAWEHSMLGCIEQCSKCGDEKVQKALHCFAGFLFLQYLTLKKN